MKSKAIQLKNNPAQQLVITFVFSSVLALASGVLLAISS